MKYVGQTNSTGCHTKSSLVQDKKNCLTLFKYFQKIKCIERIISRGFFSIKDKENHSSKIFSRQKSSRREQDRHVSQNVLESSDNIENLRKVSFTSY